MIGRVHSIQTLGAADGPGVRFVVFLQGCNLRCSCCHNPDTWNTSAGTLYTAQELVNKAIRYKSYFGAEGGLTVSGGEPLLQAEFVYEVFKLCHKNGINTCLDTSGSILNNAVKKLVTETDLVLLDIKYTNTLDYRKYVGCELEQVITFLKYLNANDTKTVVRQVIIPGLTDTVENIKKLKALVADFTVVQKLELLPFKKLCQVKYDQLNIEFPLSAIPETDTNKITQLYKFAKLKEEK